MKTIEEYLLEMVEDWRDTDLDEWTWHRWQRKFRNRGDVIWYCADILEEFVHTHPELKDFKI